MTDQLNQSAAALGVQPEPAEVVHACPAKGAGVMPCCGRTPFEVPSTDRITSEPGNVTCAGVQPEEQDEGSD